MDEFLPNVIKVEGIKAEADFTIEEDVPPPMFPDDPLALTQQEASQMTVKREASVDSTFPLSEMGSRKKRRKTNFTNLEMIVLMREVEKRKAILQGIPSMAITADTKRNAWFHVTAQVNKVGGERRLVADVRKKYRDFRSFVKKKAARIKNYQSQTGDGSPPPERLTPVEKIMAATLEDTVVSNNTNNQEAEDVSPAPDGGPREELVLRPSEEMMLNSGLLEWEAIEGLTDVDDIIDPDPSVTGSSCPVGDDAVASASAAVLTLDGQGTSVTSGTLGAAECISETRESFTGKVSTAKVLHPSTDITTRATANDHPYAMRGDGSLPPEWLTPVEKITAATLEDTVVSNITSNQEAEDVLPEPVIMVSKHHGGESTSNQGKRQRKSLTLEVKLDILKRHREGQGVNNMARYLGLSQSTVSTVIKKKDTILKAGENAASLFARRITRTCDPILEAMERLLLLWIQDQNHHQIPLSSALVSHKAQQVFEDLKKDRPEDAPEITFGATSGWFQQFKMRTGLHSLKMIGETASADEEAASAFPDVVKQRILEGGYSAKQVLNYDETSLFWKRMPSKTSIAKEEKVAPGHKAAKDRITIVLGGNAEGDLKFKPLLIHTSENPRALKGYIKDHLPVIYKFNPKAWMTAALNENYVAGYLSPMLTHYAEASNLANKFLLLVDNAPGHPQAMIDAAPNIEVLFLPKNVSSLQPMDQGVISTFKAYYQRCVMSQLLRAIDSSDWESIKTFWHSYNIKNAIDNVAAAWDEVRDTTMNGAWKNLWPECVHNFTGFSQVKEIVGEIVRQSHEAGFDEVDDNDVEELLESHWEELNTDELRQLDQHLSHDESEETVDTAPLRILTVSNLREILNKYEKASYFLKELDPNATRSGTVVHEIEKALAPYRKMYETRKKAATQTKLVSFSP